MQSGNITIGEYGPKDNPRGYIEPVGKNPSWILWWNEDGSALLYTAREANGAVKGDPIELPAPRVKVSKRKRSK